MRFVLPRRLHEDGRHGTKRALFDLAFSLGLLVVGVLLLIVAGSLYPNHVWLFFPAGPITVLAGGLLVMVAGPLRAQTKALTPESSQ